mmetsp:Transcript_8531/g.17708  ORF Transcript_8531/g.17708 Transcript_8531/m.17708 type:complete len:83 (-) Transcript_8531:295-543(-)
MVWRMFLWSLSIRISPRLSYRTTTLLLQSLSEIVGESFHELDSGREGNFPLEAVIIITTSSNDSLRTSPHLQELQKCSDYCL